MVQVDRSEMQRSWVKSEAKRGWENGGTQTCSCWWISLYLQRYRSWKFGQSRMESEKKVGWFAWATMIVHGGNEYIP